MTFDQFMQAVDKVIQSKIGLGYLDLPDIDFRAFYFEECEQDDVIECANEVIRYADDFGMLEGLGIYD